MIKKKKRKNVHARRKLQLLAAGCALVLMAGITYSYTVHKKSEVLAKPTGTITLASGTSTEFVVPEDATGLAEDELISASPTYNNYVQEDIYTPILLKEWGHAVGQDTNVTTSFDNVQIIKNDDPLFVYGPYHSGKEGAVFDVDETDGTINWLMGVNSRQVVASNLITDLLSADTSDLKYVSMPDGGIAFLNIASGSNRFMYMDSSGVPQTYVTISFPQSAYALFLMNGLPTANSRTFGFNTAQLSLYPVNLNGTLGTTQKMEGVSTYATELRSFFGSISREFIDIKNIKVLDDGSYIGEISIGDESNWTTKGSSLIVSWDSTGNLLSFPDLSKEINKTVTDRIQSDIVPNNITYFYRENSQKSEVIKITGTDTRNYELVQEYPAGTNIRIAATGETGDRSYTYAGVITNATGVFIGYEPGYVTGYMDEDFNIVSVRNASGNVSGVRTDYIYADDTKVYTSGGISNNTEFVDAPVNGWGNGRRGFYNKYIPVDDYAPAIEATDDSLLVNLDELATMTIQEQDNTLLTGEKDGTGAYSLSVYDTVDSNDTDKGQAWLESRVNRNPNDVTADIDWAALGFDKTKSGPQQVTYFVADSQKQASSTSRWVNKVTDQTVITEDNSAALDAQNFAVPLATVSTDIPDEETFKTLAKTMAWTMDTHEIYEDGAAGEFDTLVTVDRAQLAALQNATEAKPYPVDISFRAPTPSTGNSGSSDSSDDSGLPGGGWSEPGQVGAAGQTITNRVWVFVTTKNTVVDTDTGIVIYGDDYTLPLYLASQETMDDVYTTGNIRVYNYYDNTHETDDDCLIVNGNVELPTLADKDNTTGLTITNMEVINDATEGCMVQPEVQYTAADGTVTKGTIDVTITASILLHARQVIVSEQDGLTLPTEGYLHLDSVSGEKANLVVPSGLETGNTATEPAFKQVTVEIIKDSTGSFMTVEVIVPEYYEYIGYVVSNTQLPLHSSSALTGTNSYQYDLASSNYEKWLTVYIKPTAASPGEYSWDYKNNDIGMIDASP